MVGRSCRRQSGWLVAVALLAAGALAAGCSASIVGTPAEGGSETVTQQAGNQAPSTDANGTGAAPTVSAASGSAGGGASPASQAAAGTSSAAAGASTVAPTGPAAGVSSPIAVPTTSPAAGQGTTPDGATSTPAAGGSGAAPPSWVTDGTRITYYISGATNGTTTKWVEDPDGPWVDPATGKHYSEQTTQSGTGDVGNQAGDGYTQYDIKDVSSADAVYTSTLYTIDHLNNTLELTNTTSQQVTSAKPTILWVTPTFLQRALTSPTSTAPFIALQGQYTLGQTTYQAVTLLDPDPTDTQSYTYDGKTGLLLASYSTTQMTTANGETANQLTNTKLVEIRQLSLPGVGGTNPSWVGSSGTMSYTGTYRLVNPADPQLVQTAPMTMTVRYSPLQGQEMSVSTTETLQGGQPNQTTSVTGPSGLYWVDPGALATLKQGQILDTDPVTGNKLTVQSIGSGQVTLTSALPGGSSTQVYDLSSGVLLSGQSQSTDTGVTIQIQLQSK